MKNIFLFFVFCFILNLKCEEIRKNLLNDKSLLFYVPFDFSVDAETAFHNKEGKLYGEAKYEKGIVENCIFLSEEGKGSISYDIRDNISLKKGTLMFWFKPNWWGDDKTGKYTLLWIRMKDPNKYFAFHKSFSKEYPTILYTTCAWEGGANLHIDDYFKKGKWIHICSTWDVSQNKYLLYFNGKVVASGNWKDVSEEESFIPISLSIGKYYTQDNPINAWYDEFYIFKRVLSEEEIKKYYNETKPKEE